MSDTDFEELKLPELPPGTFPPGALPPIGIPGQFLRRVREEENSSRHGSRASSLVGRRRKKKWDEGVGPGGPIAQSAIFPQRHTPQGPSPGPSPGTSRQPSDLAITSVTESARPHARPQGEQSEKHDDGVQASTPQRPGSPHGERGAVELYDEGDNIVAENRAGDVIGVEPVASNEPKEIIASLKARLESDTPKPGWSYDALKKRFGDWRQEELQKRKEKKLGESSKHEPARAYQFGNTIIVEDEDGEVVRKYELPTQPKPEKEGGDIVGQGLKLMGMGGPKKTQAEKTVPDEGPPEVDDDGLTKTASRASRAGLGVFARRPAGEVQPRRKSMVDEDEEVDDRNIRFKIDGVGQRMTKEDFIKQMQKLDRNARHEVVDQSTASSLVKTLAKQDPPGAEAGPSRSGEDVSPRRRSAAARDSPAGSEGPTSTSSSLSSSPAVSPVRRVRELASSTAEPETAVERRRRLAVLRSVGSSGDNDDEDGETPAERRRREAALGVSSPAHEDEEEDSEDDDTPRVPPPRRGIRFVDVPERGRR